MAADSTTIILKSTEDWEKWFPQLKRQVSELLWPCINPNVLPEALQHLQAPPTEVNASTINPTKTSVAELTATEQKAYDLCWREYQERYKRYREEMKFIQETRQELQRTIDPGIWASVDSDQGLPDLLRTLKDIYAPTKVQISRSIKRRYQDLLQRQMQSPDWINKWEEVMRESKRHEVGSITEDGQWLLDLADKIQPINPVQAQIYRMQTYGKDTDPIKVERAVGMGYELRRLVQEFHPGGRTRKGNAFQAQGISGPEVREEASGSTRKHARGKSSGETAAPYKKEAPWCRACDQKGHSYARCWNLFPELAFPGFRPTKKALEAVASALKGDEVLARDVEELRALRKQPDQTNQA